MISNSEKNKIFKQRFTNKYLQNTNVWWTKYSMLEQESPMDWYLYFYSDFRQHTFEILRDMIWFAGFDEYIDDAMIHEIITETSIEKTKRHANVNKGLLCSFDSENSLTPQTKQYANELMLRTLNSELISKFNRTCPIT